MELLRAQMVQLTWKEERVCAKLGFFEKDYPAGYGSNAAEALRDLARAIEESGAKVWVPQSAKPYIEDGVQKVRCPECGDVHVSDFDQVLAYVCDACGAGVDVEH